MIQYVNNILRPFRRSSALAALSAATFLFPAATPAMAADQVVAAGHGSYEAINSPSVLDFAFLVKQDDSGSTQGLAIWRGPDSIIVWQVTSSMHLDDTVLFAGEIVLIIGSPPAGYEVGVTAFTAVNDNGAGDTDTIASISVVPAQFGNPTIQQIVALIGPPPPSNFQTLLSGNIWAP